MLARLQFGLLTLCVFFALLSVVIVGYKRHLFSPQRLNFHYPLLVASVGKLGEVLVYLFISVAVCCFKRCRRMLWSVHSERNSVPMWWVVVCLFIGICLSAASLAADTIVYRLLDLTTKQVIDATAPVASGILGVCCWWKYRERQSRRLDKEMLLPIDEERSATKPKRSLLCFDDGLRNDVRFGSWFAMAGIVLGTVLTVRYAVVDTETVRTHHGTRWFGIILDSATVVTASLSTLLADYILNHVGWSPFHLELVNAPSELIVLVIVTFVVHSKIAATAETPPITFDIIHEAFWLSWPIMLASPVLGFTGTYILKRTSVVTSMILNNIVMGLVVVADFVYFSKHVRLSGGGWLGLVVSACSVAAYCMFCYIGQQTGAGVSDHFSTSDDSDLWEKRHRKVGAVPMESLQRRSFPVGSVEEEDGL
jgi:hypothetical protein